jgi:hypothetical protein
LDADTEALVCATTAGESPHPERTTAIAPAARGAMLRFTMNSSEV